MTAFYNEIDPYAAAWLRNLIAAGHIAPGVVDERSVADLDPDYLCRFTQCHFFAGIGVWSRSLRLAGWPDDRPVWTGSCPCQPFSAAGKGKGHEDERHLWPTWHRLIRERRPAAVFGEQVASADGLGWLDVVLTDMEGEGYAVAAADLSAAGFGAPHIRQRLFFVAHAASERQRADEPRRDRDDWVVVARAGAGGNGRDHGAVGLLADTRRERGQPDGLDLGSTARGDEAEAWERQWVRADAGAGGLAGLVAHADGAGQRKQWSGRLLDSERPARGDDSDGRGAVCGSMGHANDTRLEGRELLRERAGERAAGPAGLAGSVGNPDSAAGFWSDPDWIPCRDGKARPVEPGTFPLAHGAPSRVGRLRAYGNAIVAPVAEGFIRAAMQGVTS